MVRVKANARLELTIGAVVHHIIIRNKLIVLREASAISAAERKIDKDETQEYGSPHWGKF